LLLFESDGVLDVFKIPQYKQTSQTLNLISVILLIIITIIALVTTDLGKFDPSKVRSLHAFIVVSLFVLWVGLVNAIGGGTMAMAVVFIFPTLMFRAAVYDRLREPSRLLLNEVTIVIGLMWLGIFIGIIGVFQAIMNVGDKQS
jgi:hypothetical protein